MPRLVIVILSALVIFGAFASDTNHSPAATPTPTHAEAMMAAMTAQRETNSAMAKLAAAANDEELKGKLDLIRTLRFQRSFDLAEKQVADLITEENPVEIRRLAMLELAYIMQDQGQLPKAQLVLNEYSRKFPKDPSLPEICLRQGLIYRQMGVHQQALAKFYQVMNLSLTLKLDRMEYYQGLVAKAQTEIAETYYLQGKYAEASEFFSRLLKLEAKTLDRAGIQYRLVRSLSAQSSHERVIGQAQSFTQLYPDSSDIAEVRFLLADSLKKLGQNREAMQQTMLLLQSQQSQSDKHPELWSYWQQRTGNEIANELYKEGDYMSALEIYMGLAKLNTSATWQLPVWYQIGLVFEHLKQPAKATEMYDQILKRQVEVRKESPSQSLLALLDMAQWRRNYIQWGQKADQAVQNLKTPPPPASPDLPAEETTPAEKERAAN